VWVQYEYFFYNGPYIYKSHNKMFLQWSSQVHLHCNIVSSISLFTHLRKAFLLWSGLGIYVTICPPPKICNSYGLKNYLSVSFISISEVQLTSGVLSKTCKFFLSAETNLIRWYNIMTSWITGIGAINHFGSTPFEVPIPNHFCNFLKFHHVNRCYSERDM
jgi:hypothetical protein